MTHLLQILKEEDTLKTRLDRAALELASIQTPDLTPEPFLDRLSELASQLGDRLRNFNDGRDFVESAERYLFQELGFHGDEEDFFDPRNSCLDQVLERRRGIPITLSLMYMEVARRLVMPVFGIGLPRHFVVEFNDGNYATYIDPFHGGRAISARDCFALAGSQVADLRLLRRVSKKEIAMRMLQNLLNAYTQKQDWARSVETLNLLIIGFGTGSVIAETELAEAYQKRAAALIELNRLQAARRDLEQYLALRPDAPNADQVRKQIGAIHQWLIKVN